MEHQHPEMLNQPLGAAQLNTYGMRQGMNSDSPAYRFYAERLIRRLVALYRDNPAVIGWQIDNEIFLIRNRERRRLHLTRQLRFIWQRKVPLRQKNSAEAVK